MNRRKFIEYSIKTIALASVPVINFFPKVNISEDEKSYLGAVIHSNFHWRTLSFKVEKL
ncbi:MAG: hypothetical protein CM15mP40_12890 [Alphaproteobacteria bacterium]|nr:MAG: hypothetical protein CM15mP40_12890 [Alphaproteobacteria bacterium]